MKNLYFIFITTLICSLSAISSAHNDIPQICPAGQKQLAYCLWRPAATRYPCALCNFNNRRFDEKVVCQNSNGISTLFERNETQGWSGIRVQRKTADEATYFQSAMIYYSDDPNHQYPTYEELKIFNVGLPNDGNSSRTSYYMGAAFHSMPTSFHCDIL